MPVAAFDTLKSANHLKQAGFSEQQAEALTATLSMLSDTQDLCTKSDLKHEISQFRQELKSDITQLRQELKSDTTQLRQELKSEMAQHRQETKNDIEQLRQEAKNDNTQLRQDMNSQFILLKWMMSVLTALSVSIIVRLFFFKPV